MTPNWITLFTLLACVGVLFLPMTAKLKLVAVSSFIGTSVIGGDEGVSLLPGPVVTLGLMATLVLIGFLNARVSLPRFRYDVLFWLFGFYALAITVLAPSLLAGAVLVIRPGLIEEGIRQAVPLTWSSSTVAQTIYLIFDMILILVGIKTIYRAGIYPLKSMVNFHVVTAVILSILVIVEFLFGSFGASVDIYNLFMGPSLIEPRIDRYSLSAYFGGSLRRAQAVFGEPSYFSAYMSGLFGGLFLLARSRRQLRVWLGAGAVLVALVATFSTTAIMSVFFVTLLAIFVPTDKDSVKEGSDAQVRRRLVWTRWIVIIGALAAIGGLMITIISSDMLYEYIFGKLTNTEGYEEGNFSSGAERLYWDFVALKAFADSWGMGVGAGGTRASSFLINILAAFGVPGVLSLLILVIFLFRQLFGRKIGPYALERRISAMFCFGWLIAMCMSVPDGLSFFYLWIQVGLSVGASRLWKMSDRSRSSVSTLPPTPVAV